MARSATLRTATAFSAIMWGMVAAPALHAQAQGSGQAAADQKDAVANDIIVTATRRDQRIQEVPVAVTAISGTDVAAAGVNDTERLAQVVPSLYITSSQQVGLGAQLRMRGVGTATGNPGLEGSVGFFLDGIYVGRSNTAFNDLLDVERVEVLRGPQGTLYGKNTSAGLINVITRAPDFQWGGNARGALSNAGGIRAQVRLSGPIVDDKLAFSVSGLVNSREGYMTDINTGQDYNDRNRFSLRGQLSFEPSSDIRLRLIADHSERSEHSTVPTWVARTAGTTTLLNSFGRPLPTVGQRDFLAVAVNDPIDARTNDTGVALMADANVGGGKLKGIVSYRNSIAEKDFDLDWTPVDIYRQIERLDDRQWTFELQYSRPIGPVDFLIGAYHFDAETDYFRQQLLGTQAGAYFKAIGAPTNVNITPALWQAGRGLTAQNTVQDSNGWSIFTHNIIKLADQLEATVGLRYQEERKTGGSTFAYNQASVCTQVFTAPPLTAGGAAVANAIVNALRPSSFCAASTPNYADAYRDDQFTGTAALSFIWSPDFTTYVSYARGFKAGGINLDTAAGRNPSRTFLPETVDSYEVGGKLQAFDNGLTINMAIFRMDFTDFQLNAFTPGAAFVLTNEGEARSRGVEVEAIVRPLEGLQLRGGVMYNEAFYTSRTLNPNLANRTLSNAPKWSGTFGFDYTQRLSERWSAVLRFDGRAQSHVLTASNLDPLSRQDKFATLNARVTLRSTDGFEIAAFGTNLTDQRIRTVGFATVGGYLSYFSEPRYYGVEVAKRF